MPPKADAHAKVVPFNMEMIKRLWNYSVLSNEITCSHTIIHNAVLCSDIESSMGDGKYNMSKMFKQLVNSSWKQWVGMAYLADWCIGIVCCCVTWMSDGRPSLHMPDMSTIKLFWVTEPRKPPRIVIQAIEDYLQSGESTSSIYRSTPNYIAFCTMDPIMDNNTMIPRSRILPVFNYAMLYEQLFASAILAAKNASDPPIALSYNYRTGLSSNEDDKASLVNDAVFMHRMTQDMFRLQRDGIIRDSSATDTERKFAARTTALPLFSTPHSLPDARSPDNYMDVKRDLSMWHMAVLGVPAALVYGSGNRSATEAAEQMATFLATVQRCKSDACKWLEHIYYIIFAVDDAKATFDIFSRRDERARKAEQRTREREGRMAIDAVIDKKKKRTRDDDEDDDDDDDDDDDTPHSNENSIAWRWTLKNRRRPLKNVDKMFHDSFTDHLTACTTVKFSIEGFPMITAQTAIMLHDVGALKWEAMVKILCNKHGIAPSSVNHTPPELDTHQKTLTSESQSRRRVVSRMEDSGDIALKNAEMTEEGKTVKKGVMETSEEQ